MPKTQTEIAIEGVQAISTATPLVTNYNVGSVIRSLVDGLSAEAANIELEIQDEVATGVVNAVYNLLGIQPTGAVGSTYLLTFSLSSSATANVTLAAGTQVTIPNSALRWSIGASITITPGGSQSISATCTTAGSTTNVPANVITQLINPATGVTVTNASAEPIILGRDQETETEIQAQVANKINTLHRGDQNAIEAGALTAEVTDASGNPTEIVAKSKAVDSNTKGLAYCYIYNGAGAASSALISTTQEIVNGYTDTTGKRHVGYKSAGVTVTVLDAPQTTVNVSIAVLPQYSYTLAAVEGGVQTAIETFFANLDLGQSVSLNQLAYAVLAVPGVADVTFSSPASTLTALPSVTVPSNAPTLTNVAASTSLAAGTYTVGYTYTNEWGETTLSPTANVTLSAGDEIQVSAITLPTGATGVNYYVSIAAGSSTLALDGSSTGAQTNITTLPAGGAASAPSTNTANIYGNAYVAGNITVSQMA